MPSGFWLTWDTFEWQCGRSLQSGSQKGAFEWKPATQAAQAENMMQIMPISKTWLHWRGTLTSDKDENVVFLLQSSLQNPLMSRRVSLWACRASFKFVCTMLWSWQSFPRVAVIKLLTRAALYLKLNNANQVLCPLPTLVTLTCLTMLTLLGEQIESLT